jgi:hypothetical protein
MSTQSFHPQNSELPAVASPNDWLARNRRWRRLLVTVSCLVLLWAGIVFAFLGKKQISYSAPLATTDAPTGAPHTYRAGPGPWGELHYTRIRVEIPDKLLPPNFAQPRPLRWHFKGMTGESVLALFSAASLSAEQRADLCDTTRWQVDLDGFTLLPSPQTILGLGPTARAMIYATLAQFPENIPQNSPAIFRANLADEWFDRSSLSPATISLVKKLLYRRGTSVMFADYDVVLPMLPDDREKRRLMKTLSRESTLLVKLRLTDETDLDALVAYWGVGGYEQNVQALLASVPADENGFDVDIAHLLPPFARKRLYTYPPAVAHQDGVNRDCHWTTMNFFAETADNRFGDTAQVLEELKENYVQIARPTQLGDVILFVTPAQTCIHSCVFIADDIVFTKNGANYTKPWILMELADLKALYSNYGAFTLRFFRRKGL